MNYWGIHRLRDMVAPEGISASSDGNRWYRAVPPPYPSNFFQRARAAYFVLTGKAYAVQWPELGDLERAMAPLKPYRPTPSHNKEKGE